MICAGVPGSISISRIFYNYKAKKAVTVKSEVRENRIIFYVNKIGKAFTALLIAQYFFIAVTAEPW